jgi:UDPglucose--hexose-1-phosphate uridylyltransferase
MPELRQGRATKHWVIVASERAKRPDQFKVESEEPELPPVDVQCPFCPGNESMTPLEVLAYRSGLTAPNSPGWRLRVIPNRFSALAPEGDVAREQVDGFFRRMNGFGIHEVIVEVPEHNKTVATMEEAQAEEVFLAYRQRHQELSGDKRFSMVIIFKNHGKRAGTSLQHTHSQLVATPIVPTHIRHLLQEAAQYFDDHGSCVFCDINRAEIQAKKRLVLETPNFVAFEPFASQAPFETWVVPKKHNASFGNTLEREAREAANVTQKILQKFYFSLGNPDFNYVIHTAPFKDSEEDYYHWYIQILPRLTTTAGFELGSGIHITTALPEDTAAYLRSV